MMPSRFSPLSALIVGAIALLGIVAIAKYAGMWIAWMGR